MAQQDSLSLTPGFRSTLCGLRLVAAGFKFRGQRRLHSVLIRMVRGRGEVAIFTFCFSLAALLSWFAGAFQAEFGGYPDEPAHYVTGLMIHDYIAGWFPATPLRFAENYYLHYPKVAFGHWPPVFHFLQAIWMLLFGESRASLLVLMALLTSAVAYVLYRLIKSSFGTFYGLGAAVLYLFLTPVQLQTTMVMTEPALALFGLLAILSFVHYLERDSWPAAIRFTLWTSLTILTKGDGLSFLPVVPLALVFAGQLRRVLDLRLWVTAVAVAVLCGPFTLMTFKMARQGWPSQFGVNYIVHALPAQVKIIFSTFGPVLPALAICSAVGPIRNRPNASLIACMTAYGLGIMLFQALVPSGVETRKLMMAFPAVLFLAAAGARQVAEKLQMHVRPAWSTAALLLVGTATWAATGLTVVDRPSHGYKGVAQYIVTNRDLRDAVILVSGNEPGLAEGMLIAEIASRERRPGHFILRASKVISHSDWTGTQNYYLLFRSPPEVSQALGTIPVNVVVVDYPATPQSPPHHRLLLNSIQKNPGQWNLLYTGTDAAAQGGARQILVFQAPNIGSKNDIKLKLDLTETLGRTLETTDH